jgi:hypothetical protein
MRHTPVADPTRVSTSISLPPLLHAEARTRARLQGHGTLSAYVRDLILRDLARELEPVPAPTHAA